MMNPDLASPPPRQELSEEEMHEWSKALAHELSFCGDGLEGFAKKLDEIKKAGRAIERKVRG